MHYSTIFTVHRRERGRLTISGDTGVPIYLRIAQWLEDRILDGSLQEDQHVYSQYSLAEMFNINPATAAKGLTLLAEEGTVYKKRGLGMYVAEDARARILEKRRGGAFAGMVRRLVAEARRLGIDEERLVERVRQIYESGAGE
jgi:Predicted transcriptional regulators